MPDEPTVAPQAPATAQQTAAALAKAEAEAQKRQADEGPEGGRYITASGDVVDAEGRPFKKDGK